MSISKVILIALVFFFASYQQAFAYLDPGTGSMILQGLIGGIAASLAIISIYWQKVKAYFNNFFSKPDDKET